MSRFIHRPRVLSIRLSDEEFDQLDHLCDSLGIESISELTRSALRHFIQHQNSNGKANTDTQVKEIRAHLSVLDREIARLANHVGLTPTENRT